MTSLYLLTLDYLDANEVRNARANELREKSTCSFSQFCLFILTSLQHKRKEDDAKSLTERVNELQQEVEYLQGELVNAAERIDQLQRKNDERKTKAHATIRSLK